jgi:murein DD-endopeptidase MepM/ murein hydrolase activator NlpD
MKVGSMRQFCFVLALLAPILSGSLRAQQQAPESAATLTVAGPAGLLQPGAVGVVTVTASGPLRTLAGEAWGRPVAFWPATPTEWRGLVGVGLDTSPGRYEIVISGTGAGGEVAQTRAPIVVERREFETRRLRVAPRMANPPESEAARIAADTRAMAQAFSVVSADRLWRGRFEAPVPGAATSSFGRLTVTNGRPSGRHQGADFRAAAGTLVRAPNAGRVVLAQDLYFAGNTVILDHGLGVFSLVAHLSAIGVQVGDRVARGDRLGESGATGRVTGPHLHWAVRFGETSVDPLSLMSAISSLPDEDAPQSVQ